MEELTNKSTQEEQSNGSKPQKPSRGERIAKVMMVKEHLALNPNSIVIVPHTEEGHILSFMAFRAEKLFWGLRKKLGVTVSAETLEKYSQAVQKIVAGLYEATGTTQYAVEIYTDDKQRLAKLRRSWVILPRTPEGKAIALCVKAVDPAIVQLRATGDMNLLLKRVTQVVEKIAELDALLKEISSLLREILPGPERDLAKYKTPDFVKKVIKSKFLNKEE